MRTYFFVNDEVMAETWHRPETTKDEAVCRASQSLGVFAYDRAEVDTGDTVIVVSRATEWQMRNG